MGRLFDEPARAQEASLVSSYRALLDQAIGFCIFPLLMHSHLRDRGTVLLTRKWSADALEPINQIPKHLT